MKKNRDHPGVIAPPPGIYLLFLLAGIWITRDHPLPIAVFPARVAGGTLVVAGLALIAAGIVLMVRAGTNVDPWHPTTSVVSHGIFGVMRNPLYAGMALIHAGIAVAVRSPGALVLLPVAMAGIHYGVILREERYLRAKFGEPYEDYCRRVKRWGLF